MEAMEQASKHWFCFEKNEYGFLKRWWGYGAETTAEKYKELWAVNTCTRCDWFYPDHPHFLDEYKAYDLDHEVGLVVEWVAKDKQKR